MPTQRPPLIQAVGRRRWSESEVTATALTLLTSARAIDDQSMHALLQHMDRVLLGKGPYEVSWWGNVFTSAKDREPEVIVGAFRSTVRSYVSRNVLRLLW